MILIIDYGAGNLFSVKNALDYLNVENMISNKIEDIEKADKLIFPGVGAFPDAMNMLKRQGLVDVIKEQANKKPFLGICLGMQLLFEEGYEFEHVEGLGLIPGAIKLIETDLKIPHMGYNELVFNQESPLLKGLTKNDYVYFVHSYMAYTESKYVAAYCDYNVEVPALVQNGKYIYGAQFHPEKSGEVGLKILENFANL